jgi:hypothetical protein
MGDPDVGCRALHRGVGDQKIKSALAEYLQRLREVKDPWKRDGIRDQGCGTFRRSLTTPDQQGGDRSKSAKEKRAWWRRHWKTSASKRRSISKQTDSLAPGIADCSRRKKLELLGSRILK